MAVKPAVQGDPEIGGDHRHDDHLHKKEERFSLVELVRSWIQSFPWLVIAIAAHVIIGGVLAVWKMSKDSKADVQNAISASISKKSEDEAPPEEEKTDQLIDPQAVPENTEAEIVSNEVAQLVPTNTETRDLSKEVGDPNSASNLSSDVSGGTGIGVGGAGHHGAGTSAFSGRRLGTGLPGGQAPNGPTQGTQRAVRLGLIWLIRHQNDNGSWSAATCKDHCPADKPCQPETGVGDEKYDDRLDVGMTGISLLAFLGAGFGHNSKQYFVDTFKVKKSEAGKDVVLKGLKWLVDHQRPDGSFTDPGRRFLYNDAIGTLALCEAYALSLNKAWKEPAQKAIDFLCKAQKNNPRGVGKWGWRYDPLVDIEAKKTEYPSEKEYKVDLEDADVSVTGWCVMALKSAELCGLNVPQETIDGALAFAKWCSAPSGLVGYLRPEGAGLPITGPHDSEYKLQPSSMAAVAMCIRIFLEQNMDDEFLKKSAEQIVKSLPASAKEKDGKSPIDYYYWYYGALALNQFDGPDSPKRTNKFWGPWNRAMQDAILALQSTDEKQCATGGFLAPDRWSYAVGPIYTTAINVLTLEVYYRYENAFGAAMQKKARRVTAPPTPKPVDKTDKTQSAESKDH